MSRAAVAPSLDWNGENGRRWVENQDRLDRMLATYGQALGRAADPAAGDHVLDVGCGAGATTFDMAARVGPSGRVVGLDISAPLIGRALDLAAERTARREGAVEFRLADAALADFAPDFDRIVSRFGVMFFDDPAAAFANLRGALKPGGRLVFVCWRGAAENDWTRLPMSAIRHLASTPSPDPEAPGPFSFGDRARIKRILVDAGYADIDIRPFDSPVHFGVGDTAHGAGRRGRSCDPRRAAGAGLEGRVRYGARPGPGGGAAGFRRQAAPRRRVDRRRRLDRQRPVRSSLSGLREKPTFPVIPGLSAAKNPEARGLSRREPITRRKCSPGFRVRPSDARNDGEGGG